MTKKTSAYYQRQYRERLRAQGLVKKEVWILPAHAQLLTVVEEQLRQHDTQATQLPAQLQQQQQMIEQGEQTMTTENKLPCWTTASLYHALQQEHSKLLPHTTLEFIDGADPIIHLEMQDYGDLPIFLTVQGEQIIVETILCTVAEVTDTTAFNDMVLRTHKYFPLSTISLDTLSNGNQKYDAYQMFGALSSHSTLTDVVLEINMLASNVMQAIEAYSEFLVK